MTIRYSRKFIKQLSKQPEKIQKAFTLRLKLFQEDPLDPILRQHPLKGKLKGYYSIDVTGDVRAIYEIEGKQIYLYVMIGTHSQLYR
ncbi:hypothetical protein A3D14_01665 [Candidatus Saccharibacteria bacterium RIFCSPHIGHO2_02_FULL_47_12]|nr:MAG: hypothetical protein A3D14_01665 [Candidatus Saccharibacteria bacterium RIFCSPHIGHO2_02_FULL_47_12]